MDMLLFAIVSLSFLVVNGQNQEIVAVRVVRFQIQYPNASVDKLPRYRRWNGVMRNSVLASLKFINKHWLICGGTDDQKQDCGRVQVTGEVINNHLYQINVTFIAERDPIRNTKVDATSTVFGVLQIGLRGGIFQYTNALKILGVPNHELLLLNEAFFCYRGSIIVDDDKCSVCPAGTYHDQTAGICEPCPKGQFQPSAGKTSCHPCDSSYTTDRIGADSRSQCILECPPGHYLDERTNGCKACGFDSYQPLKGQRECIRCRPGTVALVEASTSPSHCLENCPRGQQRSLDGSFCEPCAVGYYKSATDVICRRCPDSSTSAKSGSFDISNCTMPTCAPGTYLNVEFRQCLRCAHGTYQDEYGAFDCKVCPKNSTTKNTGAMSESDCHSTNQCKTGEHKCHWLAACYDLPDVENKPQYGCKCKIGFVGNGIECTDVCLDFCSNGGTCVKNRDGGVRCHCVDGFTGTRCDRLK